MRKLLAGVWILILVPVAAPSGAARAQNAQTLVNHTAKAMGGMAALQALKN